MSLPASNPGQTTLKGTRAVTVPAESLSSRVTELLALAKDGKINAVVVDIKTEDGTCNTPPVWKRPPVPAW